MSESVNTRRYRSPRRAAQAAATRTAVIEAARDLFAEKGYPATTVAEIANRSGVSVDTVYTAVGRKPDLVLALIDSVLGGAAAEQRDYVQEVLKQSTARGKIEVYAKAVARLIPTVAPLQEALRKAGDTDPACSQRWQALVSRRADNMLLLAADLRSTGHLRPEFTDADVADILWSTNAAEYWLLLQQRGWSPAKYEHLLVELWTRILLSED